MTEKEYEGKKKFIKIEFIIGMGVALCLCNVVVLGGMYWCLKSGKYKKIEK